ncbi:peptidase M28 [Siphonobacter sp. SORGH_AS_0500]|uniref:M20/M25/M40 family metallo-hydrolase n=1 Tax=Siphonobacter sp. SORGH_AS_0500 TaxID=1864824 RepID=UPI000CB4E292|nr:M20/M25/M40 family metallo-hydrolase [Siphonobacter sp. SORGH_AS_0500]PKK37041.1 peptidase M28 [Siphonobacter sp. SORGH_AS_0500]
MIKKIVGLFSCVLSLTASAQIPEPILNDLSSVDSNRIKAHVAYLADDQLLGRKAGSPGYKMAVDYVVEQYKKMGLQPAGEKGGYLQEVYLRNSKINPATAALTLTLPSGEEKQWQWGVDYVFTPHPEKESVDFNAPLVFVGAGFDTPQINFEDYRNIDVKGKIVVVLRKIPEDAAANVKLHLNYPATAQAFAAKHGAIGVLVCNYTNNPVVFKTSATNYSLNGINASVSKSGERVSSAAALGGKIQVAGGLSVQALQQLMQAENIALDELWLKLERGEYVSRPLKSKVKGHYESKFTNLLSYNVIGKIEGSDAKLKKEYVIHSAHLDHLGVGKPVNGDSIYNGAHDNASGVACALEIARMYANLKEKPKRSLLFLMVTAEEMGLLGSGYFTAFPTVPQKQIVADINTDMPTLLAPLESVAPLGAEHSSLLTTVENAAQALHLQVETDPDPSEGRFVRSDQYNFVKAGIPALHIKYGYAKANPALNLAEKVRIWRDAHYHKVSDNLNDSFVWSAGVTYVQVNFLVSYQIAQNPVRPTWNKGDFFEVRK